MMEQTNTALTKATVCAGVGRETHAGVDMTAGVGAASTVDGTHRST